MPSCLLCSYVPVGGCEKRILQERAREEVSKDVSCKGGEIQGITIGFLILFTWQFACWDWTVRDVIRKIIKPSTERRRCKFVDLDEVQPHVGASRTYVCYAQMGCWGDVVAALMDGGADVNRCVWLNIFSTKLWPSLSTEDAFDDSVIKRCSSFIVVCSCSKEVEELKYPHDVVTGRLHTISPQIRQRIAFFRSVFS